MLKITEFGTENDRKLIFIHGWGYTYKYFPLFITEASKTFHLYCITLPGYGGETESNKFQTIEDLGKLVVETIESIHMNDKDIILAHSMGALIMLSAYKQGIHSKVVLSGCPLKVNSPWYSKIIISSPLIYLTISKISKLTTKFNNIARVSISQLSSKGASVYEGDATAKTAFLNIIAILKFKPLKYLNESKGNITFTYGEKDKLQGSAINEGISPIIIPNGRHSSFEDNPAYFINTVLQEL